MYWLLLGGFIEALWILWCWLAVVMCSLVIYADLVIVNSELDTEEYILAALLLYVDIIRLLFYLLMILGESS